MPAGKVGLFLVDSTNEFQRLLQADAEVAAARAGLVLETSFSGLDVGAQLSAIGDFVDAPPRPEAILVMCVSDRGVQRVARRATHAGVHVFLLNRSEDDLSPIRAESPAVAVTTICPDERETGRIQARQFQRLLPRGGRVLYLQGRVRSAAARDRTAGVMDLLQGGSIEVAAVEAGWTQQDGRQAADAWLRIALRANRNVDLIGCQTDAIAQGALEAREAVADELKRSELRKVPVTGCDGSPTVGQRLVRSGALRATVLLPRAAAAAIDLVARIRAGRPLPPATVLLQPTSFPSEAEIAVLRVSKTDPPPPVAHEVQVLTA